MEKCFDPHVSNPFFQPIKGIELSYPHSPSRLKPADSPLRLPPPSLKINSSPHLRLPSPPPPKTHYPLLFPPPPTHESYHPNQLNYLHQILDINIYPYVFFIIIKSHNVISKIFHILAYEIKESTESPLWNTLPFDLHAPKSIQV